MNCSVTLQTNTLGRVRHNQNASGAKRGTAPLGGQLHLRAPRGANARWAVWLAVLVVVGLLLGRTRPVLADGECKPAAPLPQSKCNKDAQCCAGLVCGPAGRSRNNAETQCQPGCRIGEVFYASGAANPANQCQSCRPAVSTKGWSGLGNGSSCTDGDACTIGDTCSAGKCVGTPVVCNAPGACETATGASCRAGACSYPPADGKACDDGNACTQGDTCQAGACVSGSAVDCPDDRCDPSQGCVEPCGNTFCPAGACCVTGDVVPGRECDSFCSGTPARGCVLDSDCRLPDCEECQPEETCEVQACAVIDPRYLPGFVEPNVQVFPVTVEPEE